MRWNTLISLSLAAVLTGCASMRDEGGRLVTTDHYVTVKSTAPAMAGQEARLHMREVSAVPPGSKPAGVVLFIHGAGTPATVVFDLRHKNFSWMAYLADAGYDVFALDLTGYGSSTRPNAMNDACNVPKAARAPFVPVLIPVDCTPSHPTPITTIESDWNDIDNAVEYIRRLRGVDKVALIGWSQGGPRSGGYAARNPEKVSSLFLLAPSYLRDSPSQAPKPLPVRDGNMSVLSLDALKKQWDGQVGCDGQYQADVLEALWTSLQGSDPVGAKWGSGVRRAPMVPVWGFNREVTGRMSTPVAVVAPQHDKQVSPDRVRAMHADLGSSNKVLIELGCASHNAMLEKNHMLLFQASLEWLKSGKVNGVSSGIVKLGY